MVRVNPAVNSSYKLRLRNINYTLQIEKIDTDRAFVT